MSRKNPVEYYLNIDTETKNISINVYDFNVLYPNGKERQLIKLPYGKGKTFTCEEARNILGRICDKMNNTNFDKEGLTYV